MSAYGTVTRLAPAGRHPPKPSHQTKSFHEKTPTETKQFRKYFRFEFVSGGVSFPVSYDELLSQRNPTCPKNPASYTVRVPNTVTLEVLSTLSLTLLGKALSPIKCWDGSMKPDSAAPQCVRRTR